MLWWPSPGEDGHEHVASSSLGHPDRAPATPPCDQALRALRVFTAHPAFAALTITELNPLHGEADGATLERFVAGLVAALRWRGVMAPPENAVSQDPERRPAGWAWIVIRLMFPLRANPG